MSAQRRGWWGYVKWVIRDQPTKRLELAELQRTQHGSAVISPRRSPGLRRPTENAALARLPGWKQREYDAVERALEETRQLRDGEEKLKLVDMIFWRKSHTLDGAAMALFISRRTAIRWHSDFIKCVARNLGFDA